MGKQMLCKILRLLSVTWIVVVVLSSSFPNSIARAAPNPFLTTDYYGSVLNSNGTLGLVDKVSGQTIVDNVPGFFLDYGNASTIAVTPENPSFEVTSNGSDIPYGWIVDKAYIRQSAEQDSETWDLAVTGNSSDGHISIVNTTNSSSANYTLRAGETVHAPLSGSDLYEIYFGNDSSNALSASLTGNYSTASSPSPRELFSADVSAEPGMAALVYGPFTIGHSLVFDMTSTDADNRRAFSSLIPADPDKTYSGSVDSYYGSFTSGAGQANIFITYYTTDDGGGPVSTQGINIRVPDDIGAWNTNSFKWVPPYGTRSFRIELYADMGEVSTLYFDNIRVNENTTQYRTNGSDTASTVSTSGDDVTVVSVDDSNPDATVTNTYELNVHSPNVTFTSNITYKHDVTVWEERFDFVVPTQTATVMTRDLRLNEFDTTKEYLSDLYTPKVVKFSNGLSFLGADTMQAMRLRPNGGNSQLSLYGDYYLDHPYYYYVKNGNGLMTDISPQMQPGGSSHIASVTFTVSPGTTPNTLVKTRAPSGYDAALVLTNHADYETLPANRAVAYGTEDASSPAYGTKGILGRGLGWTKSVFLSGESAPYVDLSNPAYKELTDKMHLSGAEIITHAVGGHTAGRSEVDSGLQLLTQYESRNWIDHHATGGVDNWQDLASQGTIKGDPNYTLDLLARYGYKYAGPTRTSKPKITI